MTPTEKDIETAREFVEKWVGPSQDWNEAVAEFAAALAAQREKDAGICEQLSQNALHHSTVLFHHGDEEGSDEYDAKAGALVGAAAAIRKGETP